MSSSTNYRKSSTGPTNNWRDGNRVAIPAACVERGKSVKCLNRSRARASASASICCRYIEFKSARVAVCNAVPLLIQISPIRRRALPSAFAPSGSESYRLRLNSTQHNEHERHPGVCLQIVKHSKWGTDAGSFSARAETAAQSNSAKIWKRGKTLWSSDQHRLRYSVPHSNQNLQCPAEA